MRISQLMGKPFDQDDINRYECHLDELHVIVRKLSTSLDRFYAETSQESAVDILCDIRSELYDHFLKNHFGQVLCVLDIVCDR